MTRGDTYYLMDGNYGNYAFNTSESGATRITIKKAQVYDYGRSSDGCPNDISSGWNESTMGSGQAVFGNIGTTSNSGYITWDGNGLSQHSCGGSPMANGHTKDCGIKMTPSDQTLGTHQNGAQRIDGFIIRYTEFDGPGDINGISSGNFFWFRDGCNGCIVEHNWWYENSCVYLKVPWTNSFTVRKNHFRQNLSQSSCHGQWWEMEVNNSNVSIYDNVLQDIEGTGLVVCVTGCNADNFNIYGNVILRASGSSRPGWSNGLFACINSDSQCTNIKIHNNTVINYTSGPTGILDENGGGSYVWTNNLWYSNAVPGFTLNGSTFTCTHNTFLNSGNPGNGCNNTGNGAVVQTSGAANPLVNWPGFDFHLTSNNSQINGGTDLGAPFNLDPDGLTRGSDGSWDRGAYEFNAGGTPPIITTSSLPDGMVGASYSQTLTATGDTPITWDISTGTICDGLSLSGAGAITGTPTTAETCTFTARATNASGDDTQELSVTISAAPAAPFSVTGAVTISGNGSVK
jgi:hypothetical protein